MTGSMSDHPQGGTAQPAESHRGLRLLGLAAVSVGVLLLMAAAFVLSYTGIHALALSAGVSPRFARIYPVIFDAMLVVACAAVLALRGAGLPSRFFAWLTMLVLLAAAAGADTVHATNTKLPHKPAAAAAAILPWALVLLGFGLLLSMLRHARLRRAMLAAAPERAFTQPSGHVEVRQHHGLDDLFSSRNAADAPAVRYVPPTKPLPAADAGLDLAIENDPGQDDPSSDEGHPAAGTGERREQLVGYRGSPSSAFSPAPTMNAAGTSAPAKQALQTRPATDAKPTAKAKPEPEVKPTTKTKPKPEAKPTAKTKPVAKAKPAAQPATASKPVPEPAVEVAPKTERAVETAPKAGPTVETAPEAEEAAEASPEPDSGPTRGSEANAEASPDDDEEAASTDPLQWERLRSSPVPPEA